MEIKGFIPNTMLDWDGMLASTIFLPGCNFRCPFCQNPDLVLHPDRLETVPFADVAAFIRDREGWIEGVCITGGEPCMHRDLPGLCSELKGLGLGVKLDTNASFPDVLTGLIDDGLVDFIAVDVKAPLEEGAYRVASGIDRRDLLDEVLRGIDVVRNSGVEREFRTTVVPMLHGPEEVGRIAKFLEGEERYSVQRFSPQTTLDPRFSTLKPFTDDDIARMLEEARRFIPGAEARGAPTGL